ncbi:hypothetical protein L1987_54505 [Smallanthus sonchifolius]|uniref:Uncharacterized protein n=1 Tax=Smallanthus sonchifolius TaxID=185202 RepID=A0ACB9E7L4_9ASTR|nr:hypothetical protein L1987_54505 [Smallanthus sonchifolius]
MYKIIVDRNDSAESHLVGEAVKLQQRKGKGVPEASLTSKSDLSFHLKYKHCLIGNKDFNISTSVDLQRAHTISSIDGETLKPFDEYIMSKIILLAVTNGGDNRMLVVVTGASHVAYGSRGTVIPARIARKMQKKNQTVILLDPERQYIRQEGEVPVADFLRYSASRPCNRNCFDRAEIARVMNAAGGRRDALPQGNCLNLAWVYVIVFTFYYLLMLHEKTSSLQAATGRLHT